MSRARDFADLGELTSRLDTVGNSDGALSNRNILINGNFDVWQRGTSSTTSNGYGSADRWKQYTAGVGGATFAKNSDGDMHITVTGSGSGTARIGQIIEFPEKYHGQTVTFTAKVKSNSTNARLLVDTNTQWYTETDTHSGGGDWETLSITLTLESSGMTYLRFTVGLDGAQSANVSLTSSDYVTIKECQLERGDTATPFEHRSYGDELARCQRYFERLELSDQYRLNGIAWSTESMNISVPFMVKKRAAPTTTIASDGEVFTGSWVSATSSEVTGATADGATINIKRTSSYTVKYGYFIRYQNLKFDAEL